jgi:hypothetical protein
MIEVVRIRITELGRKAIKRYPATRVVHHTDQERHHTGTGLGAADNLSKRRLMIVRAPKRSAMSCRRSLLREAFELHPSRGPGPRSPVLQGEGRGSLGHRTHPKGRLQ